MIPKFTVGVNRYYYCCIILFKAILNFFSISELLVEGHVENRFRSRKFYLCG